MKDEKVELLIQGANRIWLKGDRRVSPSKSRIILILEGLFFKDEIESSKAKILQTFEELPASIRGVIEVTFVTKTDEGYIPSLNLDLSKVEMWRGSTN